jgi:predicted RNA-binding protein with PIN domain
VAYRYLIDGYNLLYALPQMPAGSWQDKREALIAWLKKRRPQGKNAVTLVFDSRQGLGDRMVHDDITVVYTAGETADDWIGDQVRKVANPRALIVVSNDRGVQILVKGTGARFMSSTDFLPKASSSDAVSQKKDTAASRLDITEELKKKWL